MLAHMSMVWFPQPNHRKKSTSLNSPFLFWSCCQCNSKYLNSSSAYQSLSSDSSYNKKDQQFINHLQKFGWSCLWMVTSARHKQCAAFRLVFTYFDNDNKFCYSSQGQLKKEISVPSTVENLGCFWWLQSQTETTSDLAFQHHKLQNMHAYTYMLIKVMSVKTYPFHLPWQHSFQPLLMLHLQACHLK